MRKLIYAINLSIDGCCDHTKFGGSSDAILRHYTKLLRGADSVIYGRKTYQLMVPYWPDVAKDPSSGKSEREFAHAFCAVRKVVFSRTLKSARGGTARIVRASLRDEVIKLKREAGGDIFTGGVSIPSQLMELGLVDEYHFVIHPAFVGKGRRLFDGARLDENLKLVGSKVFKSGAVALHYRKKGRR